VVAGSLMTAGGVFCGCRQSYDCTRCFKITTILPLILVTFNNFYFLYKYPSRNNFLPRSVRCEERAGTGT